MTPNCIDYDYGISCIDGQYKRPGLVGVHLVVEGGQAALVDIGTNFSVPGVLAALDAKGIPHDAVEYLLLTHIHLDHAGGSGELMRRLPSCSLVVHPRGARHMADPSKLVAGAVAVYGEAEVAASYGEIVPIPASRIVEAPDGFELDLAGRRFRFLDTPGHARHHNAIFDEASRGVFTGDTFGMSYRELDAGGRPFILPTTTPSQFDPDALHGSVDRLMALNPSAAYLTHFGRVTGLDGLAASLHRQLDAYVALARRAEQAGSGRHAVLVAGLTEFYLEAVRRHGCRLGESDVMALLGMDIELNAQGIGHWLDTAR